MLFRSLEFKLLPELHEAQEYIEQKLEEQEREEIFRMKKIKDKKDSETSKWENKEKGKEFEEGVSVAADGSGV